MTSQTLSKSFELSCLSSIFYKKDLHRPGESLEEGQYIMRNISKHKKFILYDIIPSPWNILIKMCDHGDFMTYIICDYVNKIYVGINQTDKKKIPEVVKAFQEIKVMHETN